MTQEHWDLEEETLEDSECEEPEELRRVTQCREPTLEQRRQHELESHVAYREWCSICVQARGLPVREYSRTMPS